MTEEFRELINSLDALTDAVCNLVEEQHTTNSKLEQINNTLWISGIYAEENTKPSDTDSLFSETENTIPANTKRLLSVTRQITAELKKLECQTEDKAE